MKMGTGIVAGATLGVMGLPLGWLFIDHSADDNNIILLGLDLVFHVVGGFVFFWYLIGYINLKQDVSEAHLRHMVLDSEAREAALEGIKSAFGKVDEALLKALDDLPDKGEDSPKWHHRPPQA